MKITNTSRRNNTYNFVLNGKAKDGVPPTGSVAPGETEDLDINEDIERAHLQALSDAGEIGGLPKRVAVKATEMAASGPETRVKPA